MANAALRLITPPLDSAGLAVEGLATGSQWQRLDAAGQPADRAGRLRVPADGAIVPALEHLCLPDKRIVEGDLEHPADRHRGADPAGEPDHLADHVGAEQHHQAIERGGVFAERLAAGFCLDHCPPDHPASRIGRLHGVVPAGPAAGHAWSDSVEQRPLRLDAAGDQRRARPHAALVEPVKHLHLRSVDRADHDIAVLHDRIDGVGRQQPLLFHLEPQAAVERAGPLGRHFYLGPAEEWFTVKYLAVQVRQLNGVEIDYLDIGETDGYQVDQDVRADAADPEHGDL